MNDDSRQSATKYIWFGFLVALVVVNANSVIHAQDLGLANVVMTIAISIAALGGTSFVWTGNSSDGQDSDTKLKRGERVKRLIDLMDEDELYELRQRLADDYSTPPDDYVMLGDDGELHRTPLHNSQ